MKNFIFTKNAAYRVLVIFMRAENRDWGKVNASEALKNSARRLLKENRNMPIDEESEVIIALEDKDALELIFNVAGEDLDGLFHTRNSEIICPD